MGQPLQHEKDVWHAGFSPDGKRVVTASGNGTARVWDAATGEAVGQPLRHDGSVTRAAFSPDGKWVVTASSDGTARLWRRQLAKRWASRCGIMGVYRVQRSVPTEDG